MVKISVVSLSVEAMLLFVVYLEQPSRLSFSQNSVALAHADLRIQL